MSHVHFSFYSVVIALGSYIMCEEDIVVAALVSHHMDRCRRRMPMAICHHTHACQL